MAYSLRTTFKRKFIAGLFVSIPAIITLLVIMWFFRFVDGLLGPFYDRLLGEHTTGLGFISAIILIFLIGIISTNVFGKKILELADRLFLRIPVFKGIYTAAKQLVDAFSPENKTSFKRFVIVEYPRAGCFAFGFLTKECSIRTDTEENEKCYRVVYIPTNNLYLGEIILFKKDDVLYTDLSIQDGIKIILSGGIATPSHMKETRQ